MRIHLSCSVPCRSVVLAMQAARLLLGRAGHRVSVVWPETSRDEHGARRIGYSREEIAHADVLVHATTEEAASLPADLAEARNAHKPVVLVRPGLTARTAELQSPRTFTSIEELVEAVACAAASAVG